MANDGGAYEKENQNEHQRPATHPRFMRRTRRWRRRRAGRVRPEGFAHEFLFNLSILRYLRYTHSVLLCKYRIQRIVGIAQFLDGPREGLASQVKLEGCSIRIRRKACITDFCNGCTQTTAKI